MTVGIDTSDIPVQRRAAQWTARCDWLLGNVSEAYSARTDRVQVTRVEADRSMVLPF